MKCVCQSKPSINVPNTVKQPINTEKEEIFPVTSFYLDKLAKCLSQNSLDFGSFIPAFAALLGKGSRMS